MREKNTEEEKQEEVDNFQKDNSNIMPIIKKLKSFFFLAFFIYTTFLNASNLNLIMSSNPSRINPILSSDTASSDISQWIFSSIFKYDKNGKIVNDIGQSYKFLNDTTLIIKIKENVLWHDKVLLSIDDVIFTYNQIMNPKIFTPLKSSFQYVKSIIKLDKFTMKVIYKEPYFKSLNIWMVGILPYHILKDDPDLMKSNFNKNPIGTGSYKLKTFKTSSDVILVANEDYHDGKPKIDTITYKFVPDATTSFFMTLQNKIDVGSLTPLQVDRQLPKDFNENYKIFERPSFSYSYMGFNLKNKKFSNLKVRQAINLGINRQELVDILFFGHGKVCTGPFLPGTFAFNENIKIKQTNIKKAIRLLREAGYDKKNPLSFEVITNANNSTRVYAAQILQYQLEKIGVEMKIRVMEWQAFLNTVVLPRKFEAIILGWSLSLMPDAKSIWHSESISKGGFNLVHYKNKTVDALIEKGAKTINVDKLSIIYKSIFKHIANDLPYLFLYIPNSITVVNKKIKNVEPSFTGVMHNQQDWIK